MSLGLSTQAQTIELVSDGTQAPPMADAAAALVSEASCSSFTSTASNGCSATIRSLTDHGSTVLSVATWSHFLASILCQHGRPCAAGHLLQEFPAACSSRCAHIQTQMPSSYSRRDRPTIDSCQHCAATLVRLQPLRMQGPCKQKMCSSNFQQMRTTYEQALNGIMRHTMTCTCMGQPISQGG